MKVEAIQKQAVTEAIHAAFLGGFAVVKTADDGHTICGLPASGETVDIYPDGSWVYVDVNDPSASMSDYSPAATTMLKLFMTNRTARKMFYEGIEKGRPQGNLTKRKGKILKGGSREALKGRIDRVKQRLTAFLKVQARIITPQIVEAYKSAGYPKAKKSVLQGALLKVEDITPQQLVAKVKLEGWDVMIGRDITPEIEAAFNEAGMSAMAETGATPVDTMTELVNDRAAAYAAQNAGELVTQIEDATRNMIASTVEDAINNGWGSYQLAQALEDSQAFDAVRADRIAAYELGSALEAGNLTGWQASGVVTGKQWVTAEDELVSDECDANAAQGVIPIDEPFQSGDDAPLAHPYCRCAMVGVTDSGDETGAEE